LLGKSGLFRAMKKLEAIRSSCWQMEIDGRQF